MKRFSVGFFTISLLAVFAAASFEALALSGSSNWAQWRGPQSQGVSDDKDLPSEWSATKNVQWKTAIEGRGHSSPIVWGKRIFLTTGIEGEKITDPKPPVHMIEGKEFKHPDWAGMDHRWTFKVMSVDADTGKIIWEKVAYDGPTLDYRHRRNTYASATPATDGKYVYAYFGSEGVYCYDFNGKLVWKKSLGPILTLGMGAATSPVLYENLLILQCDQNLGEASFIIALDKKTGTQVWNVKREVEASWTTPIIVKTEQRTELITSGNQWIISYDPATGKEIWRAKGINSNAIHTPMVGHGMVYISAGYPEKRTLAIKLGGTGDVTSTHVAWKYEKGTAYVASPILYGDYIYLLSDKGMLTCLDAKTGEVKYEGARVPNPATFMSSPVAFDGKILISSEDGDTYVVKAGPTHEILRTNSLAEPIYSSPALAGGKVYIRGGKSLFCIANGAGKS
jgi:outer membrane protein assembly factor BamB